MKKVILGLAVMTALFTVSCKESTENKVEDATEAVGNDIEATTDEAIEDIDSTATEAKEDLKN